MSRKYQSIGHRVGILLADAEPSPHKMQDESPAGSVPPHGEVPEAVFPEAGSGLEQLVARIGESRDLLEALSHELITPLNGIAGMAEVLTRSPLSEEQADQVRTILAMGQELAANIEFALCRARKATGMGIGSQIDHPVDEDRVFGPLLTPQTRILVVDDTAVNREVAVLVLRRHLKVQADVVTGGAQALAVLRTHRYDAILMDCNMPGMDGYETTRRIRTEEGILHPSTPIIALTANVVDGHCRKCLEMGMDAYLNKPVKAKELRRVLMEVLARI